MFPTKTHSSGTPVWNNYLSLAPQAEPQAAGVSAGLSDAPQAEPQAEAGASSFLFQPKMSLSAIILTSVSIFSEFWLPVSIIVLINFTRTSTHFFIGIRTFL